MLLWLGDPSEAASPAELLLQLLPMELVLLLHEHCNTPLVSTLYGGGGGTNGIEREIIRCAKHTAWLLQLLLLLLFNRPEASLSTLATLL